MIDLLANAARFDFLSVKKSPQKKISSSMLMLIFLTILSISLIFVFQLSKLDTPRALQVLEKESYQIEKEGISLSDTEIQQLNQKLSETGYGLSREAIYMGKNEILSFSQLLALYQAEKIDSVQINSTIDEEKTFIEYFVWFYLYIKESVTLIWVILLGIFLARITQKYVKQTKLYTYQRIFGWVVALMIDPILVYTVMGLLEVKWSYRIFIFTLLYVMVDFIFSRYLVTHVTIEGEERSTL